MASEREIALRQPLLSALTDDDPESLLELKPSPKQQAKALRESVRLDLQNLLNTRQRCLSWPKEFSELDRSVLDYGIPDLTGANLSTASRRNAFLQQLAGVIQRHDARFHTVKIEPLDNADPHDRTLRFRIEATLRVETETETAIFDFQMEPVSRQMETLGRPSP